jgi:biopolymer transport protein ExbD
VVFQTVTVRADGSFLLGTRPLNRAQLAQEFAAFAAQPNQPVVRVRVDADATAQHYIVVFDELKKANLTKVSMDTQVAR